MIYKIYGFLLAALVGCELVLGIVVAPILFKGGFLSEILPDFTQFEAGILMGQIFHKFNYALMCVSVISIVFETFGLFIKTNSFYLRFSRFCLSLIVVLCTSLFVFYFTDYILQAQSLKDTQTMEFKSIHDASEYVFKIICIAQMILYFTNKEKK